MAATRPRWHRRDHTGGRGISGGLGRAGLAGVRPSGDREALGV